MSIGCRIAATVFAVVMATVWPRELAALPFIVIGLALIFFPRNRWIQLALARGMPLAESPPFALSVVGWLFILAMPPLLAWLIQ